MTCPPKAPNFDVEPIQEKKQTHEDEPFYRGADQGAGSRIPTVEICRKHGLRTATLYKLTGKYGGMEVSDARRLRKLEDENGKLKRLLGGSMLDNVILKDLLGKA